jgi:hypothetical protein
VVADRLLAPVAVALLAADRAVADAVVAAVAVEVPLLLAAMVAADAVAKLLLQRPVPFAVRFGFLTLLPKKFL